MCVWFPEICINKHYCYYLDVCVIISVTITSIIVNIIITFFVVPISVVQDVLPLIILFIDLMLKKLTESTLEVPFLIEKTRMCL